MPSPLPRPAHPAGCQDENPWQERPESHTGRQGPNHQRNAHRANISNTALPPLRWVTVAASVYLARFGTPQSVDDLKDHHCLTVRNLRSGSMLDWQFMIEGKVRDVSVEGRLIVDIGDALVDGAVGGFGIVQVMDFAVRDDLAAGRLVRVLEDVAGRSRAISLIYPPSRHYSPKLMAFAEALANARW